MWILDDGTPNHTDEGRALAEIAYDIGPGFDFVFMTSDLAQADIGNVLRFLGSQGAIEILVDDTSYVREPVFQDGPVAQAIKDIYETNGVLAFASAGNLGGSSYYGTWSDTDGDLAHDFAVFQPQNPGDPTSDPSIDILVEQGENILVGLHWAEPWNIGQVVADVDVEIWNYDYTAKVADSDEVNSATDQAVDVVTFTNDGSHPSPVGHEQDYHIVFRAKAGLAPVGKLLFAMIDGGVVLDTPYTQNQRGIAGNHAAENQFTIGAVQDSQLDQIAEYSSHGPSVQIQFDTNGQPLNPTFERLKPDFTAAEGFQTTVPNFTDAANFAGTSASVANAGGVAGLVLAAARAGGTQTLTYLEMFEILRDTAIGAGTGSWDAVHGFGRINALGAGLAAYGPQSTALPIQLNPFGQWDAENVLLGNNKIDAFGFVLADTATAVDGTAPVTIRVHSDGVLDPGLILYQDGQFLEIDYNDGPNGKDAVITRNILVGSLFQVEVFAETDLTGATDEQRTYTITIETQPPLITELSPDLEQNGNVFEYAASNQVVLGQHDADYYQVTWPAAASSMMDVEVSPVAGAGDQLNSTITLYDRLGNQVLSIDSVGVGEPEQVLLVGYARGEKYYLRVGSASDASSGEYLLSVRFSMDSFSPATTNYQPDPPWIELGPEPAVGAEVEYLFDDDAIGAIQSIAVHPGDPDIIYVGTVASGIWKTTSATWSSDGIDNDGDGQIDEPDEVVTWTPLTDNFGAMGIGDIVFSMLDPSRQTLFAGTGDYRPAPGSLPTNPRVFGGGQGILKTTDGGQTWERITLTESSNPSVVAIVPTSFDKELDPATPETQVVLAATRSAFGEEGGLFRSEDGGKTWTQISGADGSSDGWDNDSDGFIDEAGEYNLPPGGVTGLIQDPTLPYGYYAAVANDFGTDFFGTAPNDHKGIYHSLNGGESWLLVDVPFAGIEDASRIDLASHPTGGVFAGIITGAETFLTTDAFRGDSQLVVDSTAGFEALDTIHLGDTWDGTLEELLVTRVTSPTTLEIASLPGDPPQMHLDHDLGQTVQLFGARLVSLYRRESDGLTWTPLSVPQTDEIVATFGIHPAGRAMENFAMLVDDADPPRLFLGGDEQPQENNPYLPLVNSLGSSNRSGRLFA